MPRVSRFLRPALLLTLLLQLTACGVALDQLPLSGGDSAAFAAYLDSNWQEDLALQPTFASRVGVKAYQDRWTPVDEAYREAWRARNEQRLAELAQFDRSRLTPQEQLSYDLYELNLKRLIAADAYRHQRYVITQHGGPHTHVPSHLINIHRIGDEADARAYVARLENVSNYFDGVVEQLQLRADEGMVLAAWQYPKIIESARNVISGAPFDDGEDSTLWADFQRKVAALDLPQAQRDELLGDARKALRDDLAPAYEGLIAVLEEQAQQASQDDGVWRLPQGEAYYGERLNWYTTTDLTADQVHELGLSEVARIHGEMRAIMAQVGFQGELGDFFTFMREDPQFYYPNTDAGREAYLTEARALIDDMYAALPDVFGLLPQAPITVKRVEAFRERAAGKAFYQSPAADGSRPGIYYANLYDMASMPKYQMAALAFHEGVPGHHMQRAISVELTGVPAFQKYVSFTAYTEGWGLYSETLAGEMGFYPDPYADFGRLAMELWRACRLVVDTGLHSKRWTREEAVQYLLTNTPNPEADARKAIDRYIALPGQATAYMVGKLKIMELREKARAALGDDFDLRDFHDEVLKDGPVPLSVLEAKVDALVERSRSGSTAG